MGTSIGRFLGTSSGHPRNVILPSGYSLFLYKFTVCCNFDFHTYSMQMALVEVEM